MLAQLPENSVDLVLTDPPYEINFQNREWDRGGLAYSVGLWTQVLRVCRPGAHVLVAAFPKRVHRVACALEDAGADIRGHFLWLNGQGMRKGPNLPARCGSELRPNYEPWVIGRKALDGTLKQNVTRWGTGAVRVGYDTTPNRCEPGTLAVDEDLVLGPEKPYFYACKVNAAERDWGCSELPLVQAHDAVLRKEGTAGMRSGAAGAARNRAVHNAHPCLKPLSLLAHLVELYCPEGGVVLDPFAGVLSSAMAAVSCGRLWLGAEIDPQWWPVGEARMAAVTKAL